MSGKPTKLAIDKIVIDESIYPRNGISGYNIVRLAHALEAGAAIPPLTVEAGTWRLVDGRHRLEALKRRGIKSTDVFAKKYASEAELFADAVRLNITHGAHLDQFSVRNAIIRLMEYGYERTVISDIVRIPPAGIDKIEKRGFASDTDGKPIALKGGLSHMHGETLSPEQQQINRHYSGGKAVFHVRQLNEMLITNMWPRNDSFVNEMERLIETWSKVSAKAA